MSKPKIIAFYLPQYHPTPDNDKWWGKGFTEWTNVGKAKPLFLGHYQPKVPADLGYYDLRLPEVREAQAELAKEAGIYGFCYYHYWFGNGKEELELPFNEVLRLGKPDFPFMLCWANESWHKKFWNKDGKGTSKEVLIEQTYPGEKDIIDHFYRLLPAFKDPRYIKIEDRIAFMIYKAHLFPDLDAFTNIWQSLAKKENLPGFYFIAQKQSRDEFKNDNDIEILDKLTQKGINALNVVRLYDAIPNPSFLRRIYNKLTRTILSYPVICPYKKIISNLICEYDKQSQIIPTIIPNWDHTARSGKNGIVFKHSTPELFNIHLNQALNAVNNKTSENRVLFLKSWNEWGEGNYIEPDLKYGHRYLEAIKSSLSKKDYD